MDDDLERRRYGMTAEAWPTSTDAWAMLHAVARSGPSERKVRLFNVALCRRDSIWGRLPPESQAVLLASERRADEAWAARGDGTDLCGHAHAVVERLDGLHPPAEPTLPDDEARRAREGALAVCYAVAPGDLFGAAEVLREADPADSAAQAELVRELFGDRFRGKTPRFDTLPPTFQADDAFRLAQRIYDLRDFASCPQLADALAAAGCRDDAILSHLRSSGPHVRGCWALDWVLGKK